MTDSAKRLLADIEKMAPDLRARAAEIEAARRIPLDLVEALRSIGLFRMLVPRSHGGLELDLPTALAIIAALSRIDGSIGWTAMIAGGTSLFASLLPRETYERAYGNGPDTIIAGSSTPAGTAEAVAGGWRVNGRWPFLSGCQHAEWIGGFCIMTKDGEPLSEPAGAPMVRAVVLPARDWQIEDTWHAMGLKGTGSHHVVLRDMMVPAENFLDPVGGVPCLPGPLYQAVPQLLPLLHAAFGVGVAESAVDELVALANTGRQQLRAAVPMRESETFHYELGRVHAELRAARALLEAQATSHWRHALAGTLKDEVLNIQGTQSGVWVATACGRIGDACFALAGGCAVYESSPLQRRLRDLHTAAQHFAVQQRHYIGAGKLLLDNASDASAGPVSDRDAAESLDDRAPPLQAAVAMPEPAQSISLVPGE
jgi:alkylation response protein AidB-like acyl-CoA dehydrogenase